MTKSTKQGYAYNTKCRYYYPFYNTLFYVLKFLRRVDRKLVQDSYYDDVLTKAFEWSIDYRRSKGINIF